MPQNDPTKPNDGKTNATRQREQERTKSDKGPLARYQFRVMFGSSAGQDYTQPPQIDVSGKVDAHGRRPTKLYRTGEVQWSNTNLAEQHNKPGSAKFRLVKDHGADADTTPELVKKLQSGGVKGFAIKTDPEAETRQRRARLQGMDVGDLRSLAADNEVDLTGADTKEDIIAALELDNKLFPTESVDE